MEDLKKKLKVKNWKETAKDTRTWRDLAKKAKTQKGLQCQMIMMITSQKSEDLIYASAEVSNH
jgi:hypothetical protein